jgi:WD40 repeat protein
LVKCLCDAFTITSTDGNRRYCIASGSNDDTIRVWDVNDQAWVRKLVGHDGGVTSLSVGVADDTGSGRRLLASASWDDTVRLWDADVCDPECVHVLEDHEGYVTCVSGGFVDGSRRRCIASTSADKTLRVRDATTGECVCIVSVDVEMGFSCPTKADCVSVVTETIGGPCRLAIVAGGRIVILEHCGIAAAGR